MTDEKYEYECCRGINGISDCLDNGFYVFNDGIYTADGKYNFISKEAVKKLEKQIHRLLEKYDEYENLYKEKQLKLFEDNCIKLSKENKKSKLVGTKKQRKITPSIDEGEIGIVYIMKNCGYYKIGKAKLGSSRFGEYTKLPEVPEYIIKAKVKNYSNVELALHKRYEKQRLRDGQCEWFDLTDEHLQEIKEFVDKYVVSNKEVK